ncbi:MAG: DUF2878 domain-containing protein [Rudaea sp.]|uniref:DUF2878 domain-containing protein n=1 Tax=unclassified Rudaea TaxID=2627037 RepID=UPI0010FA4006|nr:MULTISPECIES: DUF2878 domain-containing protein [unclassified Rudaea]MBN8888177.1 DUF2878 domain-containing protein [Rudaea sp.]MBR0345232.1 DUF2878 domain-containing protein [Rudaea sp.]
MGRWLNIAGYQLVWFAAVYGAATARPWMGVGAALFFVAGQMLVSRDRSADARTLLLAIGLGIVIDGSLAATGLLRYASPYPALGAPAWILAIWAAFALTVNHSLAFLRNRPLPAALLGAIGAPLAYSAAARGFGAVAFGEPRWTGLLALSVAWAGAMTLFAGAPMQAHSAETEVHR